MFRSSLNFLFSYCVLNPWLYNHSAQFASSLDLYSMFLYVVGMAFITKLVHPFYCFSRSIFSITACLMKSLSFMYPRLLIISRICSATTSVRTVEKVFFSPILYLNL